MKKKLPVNKSNIGSKDSNSGNFGNQSVKSPSFNEMESSEKKESVERYNNDQSSKGHEDQYNDYNLNDTYHKSLNDLRLSPPEIDSEDKILQKYLSQSNESKVIWENNLPPAHKKFINMLFKYAHKKEHDSNLSEIFKSDIFNDYLEEVNNPIGCNSKLKLPYVPSISSNNNINAMCFIKDRLVCGSGDNTVSIWDLTNNACIFILIGHTSSVNDVCIFGNNIASCSNDTTIKLWNIKTGENVKTFCGHTNWVLCIRQTKNNRLISGSYDETIMIWDSNGDCKTVLRGHAYAIYSLIILNESKVASGSIDNTIKIWDTFSGDCLCTLQAHTDSVMALCYISSANKIASGGIDKSIIIWAIQPSSDSYDCEKLLYGHTDTVRCLCDMTNGLLASGSYDNSIRIWKIESELCLHIINVHANRVRSILLSLDGSSLISAGGEKTIYFSKLPRNIITY